MTDKRINIIIDSRQAKRDAKELDSNVKDIGKSADAATFAVNKLAAAISSAIAVDRIVRYSDAWTQVENQLRRTVSSNEDLARVTAEVLSIANDTRSELESTTALYTSLTIATQSLGVSQQEVAGVTKTINNLFLEAGKSSAETAGAIRQLGQALESGALRGDEFNSVAEGAPGILRAIEQQTGKTRAELRDFASEGQITAQLIVESLQNYSKQAQDAADITERTLAQSWVVAENNAKAYVGASRLVSEAVSESGNIIVGLSENLDVLVNIAGAAAALYIARLIPSIAASTSGFIAQAAAALRATQTVNAMGVVVARTTVSMNALALASRGAGAAMAFLGGPAGIVFLAVAALGAFALQADRTETSTNDLASTTDVLTESYKGLTKAQAEAQRLEVVKAINEQETAIASLQAKIERMQITTKEGFTLTFDSFDETELIKAEAAIDSAGQRVDALRERLSLLNKTISGGGDDAGNKGGGQDQADKDRFAQYQAQLSAGTASLQRELELRRNISQIYRQGELDANASQFEQERALQQINEQTRLAELQARYEEDVARRQFQFNARLENMTLEEQQRLALESEFMEQEKILKQSFEEEKSAIELEGAKKRNAIAKAEMQSRLSNAQALGNSLISLGKGQSKTIFGIGQKLAMAQAAAALPSAVIQSFQNGGGYPWGLVPAGAMLATGLKNINDIRKAGSGLGASSAGSAPSISLPSGASSSSPSASQTVSGIQPDQARNQDTILSVPRYDDDEPVPGAWVNRLMDQINEQQRNGKVLLRGEL